MSLNVHIQHFWFNQDNVLLFFLYQVYFINIYIFFTLDQLIEEDCNIYNLKHYNIKLCYVLFVLFTHLLCYSFLAFWLSYFILQFIVFFFIRCPLCFSAGIIIITISADRNVRIIYSVHLSMYFSRNTMSL